eukprot:952321-Rhodomonas_salina.1
MQKKKVEKKNIAIRGRKEKKREKTKKRQEKNTSSCRWLTSPLRRKTKAAPFAKTTLEETGAWAPCCSAASSTAETPDPTISHTCRPQRGGADSEVGSGCKRMRRQKAGKSRT